MSSRRYTESDYSDTYDRPRHRDRDRKSRRGEERFYEEEVEIRRRGPSHELPREPPFERERLQRERERDRDRDRDREREVIIREDIRRASPPEFLREDYGRTSAGPMVLSRRDREEYEFVPRARRRSSPSPPSPGRKVESEEIIIKADEGRRRPPSPSRDREEIIITRGDRGAERRRARSPSREREEIIITRGDREPERRTPRRDEIEEVIIREDKRGGGRRHDDIDREEVIIREDKRGGGGRRREEIEREDVIFRDNGRRETTEIDFERDEISSRRGKGDRRARDSDRGLDRDREEIIITRRGDRDRESRYERPPPPPDDDLLIARPISHERQRSHSRMPGGESDEIVIRHDERKGREEDQIIIRRDRSSSEGSHGRSTVGRQERVIRAPDIHQNVIMHHRHIYHDEPEIVRSRAATPPPAPVPPPAREEDVIEIHRRGERNGRAYDEDIVIAHESAEASPARRPPESHREESVAVAYEPSHRGYGPREDRDIREEADYYNQRALERSYVGEAHEGATRDWAIVDVPPGTRRVRMDGAGGGSQEVTWQRYNGVRRSKFHPDGSDEGYGSEIGRPAMGGDLRRYQGIRDPREGMWTEITKDLVVKEALERAGYEFEETEDFYYVMTYLRYEDVNRLVGFSEDIRAARKRRIHEINWERRALPPLEERRKETLVIEEGPSRPERRKETLVIEEGPSRPEPRPWDREDEVYREREVVIRPGRPYR